MLQIFNQYKSFTENLCLRCGAKVLRNDETLKLPVQPDYSSIAVCSDYCRRKYVKFFGEATENTLFKTELFAKNLIWVSEKFISLDEQNDDFDMNLSRKFTQEVGMFVTERASYPETKFSEMYFIVKAEFLVRCAIAISLVEEILRVKIFEVELLTTLCFQFGEMLKERNMIDEAMSVILLVNRRSEFQTNISENHGSAVELAMLSTEKQEYYHALQIIGSLNKAYCETPQILRKVYRLQFKSLRLNKNVLRGIVLDCESNFPKLVCIRDNSENVDVILMLADYVEAVTSLRLGWKYVENAYQEAKVSFLSMAHFNEETYAYQRAFGRFFYERTKAALVFLDEKLATECLFDYEFCMKNGEFRKDSPEYGRFFSAKALFMEKYEKYDEAVGFQFKALGVFMCYPTYQKKALTETSKLLERHLYLQNRRNNNKKLKK